MKAPIVRALLSVSDKTGLVDFAKALQARGIEILSTGGTATHLKDNGIKLREVSDYTGFPEIMDGRVKTLQPKIHGGLLADRNNPTHRKAMDDHGIGPIDLLVVNLYPFQDTVNKGADRKTCIENIDIGGPAMIRAAAKNHAHVGVITDPADYEAVLADLAAHGGTFSETLKQSLARKAFALTAAYDSAIAHFFSEEGIFPQNFTLAGTLAQTLRYGENPHQQAALYLRPDDLRPGAARAQQLQGKELSFNNINDTDAAFNLVCEFDRPACVIVKHANPCGVALNDNLASAYEKAKECDPVSAFGGIIAFNRPLDAPAAQAILSQFAEVIIAPAVLPEALPLLAQKPNVRVLVTHSTNRHCEEAKPTKQSSLILENIQEMDCFAPDKSGARNDVGGSKTRIQPLTGGFLVQTEDDAHITEQQLQTVTKRAPSPEEIADMLFAFTVAKHVKSNAIVYAQSGMTVGIGAGQMSRVDSSRIAAWKMGERSSAGPKSNHQSPTPNHLVLASDAFFPFADGLIAAAEAGVTAIIQPGGSIRDAEVIAAADERGLAMVFTGVRHFRH